MKYSKEQILNVIKVLGIKEGKISGDEYITNCPLHLDTNPSFGINLNSGLWNCFSEGLGGTLEQLIKLINQDAIKLIDNLFDDNLLDMSSETQVKFEFDFLEKRFPFPIGVDVVPDFIWERGFDKKVAKKWEWGYNGSSGSLVVPIRNYDGTLISWFCRRPKNKEPRYYYPPDFEKSKVLFGEHNLREEQNFVCITEGPLDTIWLDQHNFNSVALLGKFVSEEQIYRLVHLNKREYIICLDNDKAGQEGIYGYYTKGGIYKPGLKKKLEKYGILSFIELPSYAKDIQDVRNPNEVISIINNRKILL